MIRRGRTEGWLRAPIEHLPTWANFHGVTFDGVKVGPLPGFEHRGSTVLATRELVGGEEGPLMTVPEDMILSRKTIDIIAKWDHNLREVLDALDNYGRTSRGAILTFLLVQASICCPDSKQTGIHSPLTEYIKYLPDEPLPTLWTEEELELLEGTTLRDAVRAKMESLLREFELFRAATETVGWCAKYWWDEDEGLLTFDDWMRVDAMYRSRALEFPVVGGAMLPCIDMANHASGDATVALYDADDDGNAVLVLRDGKTIPAGGEITITYGDDKGACEYIFSYGFLEDSMKSAKVMFLSLSIPDDDPLRPAKLHVSNAAPGFRLKDKEDDQDIEIDSDFVWLAVVNEEDGLEFKLKQTVDGEQEVQALWKEGELNDVSTLRKLLQDDPMWEVYQLRAAVLMQERVEAQLEALLAAGDPVRGETVREGPWRLATRLRELETDMLRRAVAQLNDEKSTLLDSETVLRYLAVSQLADEAEEEDVDFT